MTRGDAEMPRPIKVNICVFLWFKQKVRSVFQSKSPGRNLDVPDVRPTDVPLIDISFFFFAAQARENSRSDGTTDSDHTGSGE